MARIEPDPGRDMRTNPHVVFRFQDSPQDPTQKIVTVGVVSSRDGSDGMATEIDGDVMDYASAKRSARRIAEHHGIDVIYEPR